MSREIKFREWDSVREEIYGNGMGMSYGKREDYDDSIGFRFSHEEGGERILMQYIGRKDEDECEIYEEDIVQVIEQGHNMGFYYENEYVGIVKYDEEYCSFKLKLIKFVRGGELIPDEVDGIPISFEDEDEITDYWFSEWIVAEDMKILGNTFENPELLEQSNE